MKKIMRRTAALVLALTLCVSQLAIPAMAEETTPPTEMQVPAGGTPAPETPAPAPAAESPAPAAEPAAPAAEPPAPAAAEIVVPAAPGGGNESVEVDIVVSANTDGTVTTTIETPAGGDTTDSGSTVTYESEITETSGGTVLEEDTEYTAVSSDGTYTAQGGTESETVVSDGTNVPEVSVDILDDNGNIVDNQAGGKTTTVVQDGSVLPSQNPANYDATTVTTTEREVTVDVTNVTVDTKVEMDGTLPNTESEHNYTGGASVGSASYSLAWTNTSGGAETYNGSYYIIWTDAEGNIVNDGTPIEWQLKNTETNKFTDNLYCVDASISTKPYADYRLANLEDAVEENYYTEEEAAHLRYIATNGYDWNAENGSPDAFNEWLRQENILAEGEALTKQQAATVTQMAIWRFGNRFEEDASQLQPSVAFALNLSKKQQEKISPEEEARLEALLEEKQALENPLIMKVYNELIKGTMDAPSTETQIINQEKFIDDMVFTVGSKATSEEANAANTDGNDTNDVYNTTLKFSMVVTPDKDKDSLIVKVYDENGKERAAARIAGKNSETEDYKDAEKVEENGKTYYVIRDLELAENSPATFNLKLEGTQELQEGVYVFETPEMTQKDMVAAWAQWKNCSLEAAEADIRNRYSKDGVELKDRLESLGLLRSQNFITTIGGTADVDVGMQIDLTFNVEEQTITTTHTWRSEQDSSDGGEGGEPEPRQGRRFIPGVEVADRVAGPNAAAVLWQNDMEAVEGVTIPDEAVPLAAAPRTGDATEVLAVISLISLTGALLLKKKAF